MINFLHQKKYNKEITNTRIGSKDDNIYGGSYSIPTDEYELFLKLFGVGL